jgi:hypothetical protein
VQGWKLHTTRPCDLRLLSEAGVRSTSGLRLRWFVTKGAHSLRLLFPVVV